MSKKINETSAINATVNLENLMNEFTNVSLRRLAVATEVSYPRLLKAMRKPIEGVPYDPNAINYQALVDVFTSKEIELSEIDWIELNRQSARPAGLLIKDMEQFQIGDKVWLRRNNTAAYEIVYKTESHVVIQLEGTEEPISWQHSTFLLNGPARERREID